MDPGGPSSHAGPSADGPVPRRLNVVFSLLGLLLPLPAVDHPVETRFVQVAPVIRGHAPFVRGTDQLRAVVLLHGVYMHPFKKDGIAGPVLREWQKPGSVLVARLAHEADVFSFAYAQTTPADEVADAPVLAAGICQLREMGYEQVVLVGYSAGGVIARDFVENRPGAGVTKVVQVCAPNTGSGWANFLVVRPSQADFLASLTKNGRRRTLRDRSDRRIPSNVQFACVVGTAAVKGDGFVLVQSQWSGDLQRQGVPAYPIALNHWQIPRVPKGAELIAEVVATPQLRWDANQVARAQKLLFKTARPIP